MINYCAVCKAPSHVRDVICTRCFHDTVPPWTPFDVQKKPMEEIPVAVYLVYLYKESFGKGKDFIQYDTCSALRETLKQIAL
jgi:hypothetical protein